MQIERIHIIELFVKDFTNALPDIDLILENFQLFFK